MRVDPIKPTLKVPGTKRLKLKRVDLLSSFAFKFNLRRYNKDAKEGKADEKAEKEMEKVGRCRLTL